MSEASKSIPARVRGITGLAGDGAALYDASSEPIASIPPGPSTPMNQTPTSASTAALKACSLGSTGTSETRARTPAESSMMSSERFLRRVLALLLRTSSARLNEEIDRTPLSRKLGLRLSAPRNDCSGRCSRSQVRTTPEPTARSRSAMTSPLIRFITTGFLGAHPLAANVTNLLMRLPTSGRAADQRAQRVAPPECPIAPISCLRASRSREDVLRDQG